MSYDETDLAGKVCPDCGKHEDLTLYGLLEVYGHMDVDGNITKETGNEDWLCSDSGAAHCSCGWEGDPEDLSMPAEAA